MSKLLKSIMLAAGILVSATSIAADYPSKNIRLVVPFGAGGGTDAVGRTLANSAKDILGQNISIMNVRVVRARRYELWCPAACGWLHINSSNT